MSEVWLAKHQGLAVPVVVKTLKRALREQAGLDASARVKSEARLMARVASPRIVRALDAGEVPGTGIPYLVQEYVDGLDFAELDRRRRAALGLGLPLWLVCHVMREMGHALRAAHQTGVIHRDLKPSNVFGATETGIRLGDFGIAVAVSEGVRDSAGTLKFMAPEQFQGGDIGRHTDVWGAGATACDLRYGHAPFESVGDILDPSKEPRLPAPITPAEAYFQQLVRCMLAKDLRKRPEDMLAPIHHFSMLGRALEPPQLVASRIDGSTLQIGPLRLTARVGDISLAKADAIVSSANFEMKMRSGVGEALRLRGGDEIEEEAMKGGENPLGSCLRTQPGALATKHVFHAVGAWNEVSCVGRAFARALLLADEHGCSSLAVPALGTGAARVGLEMCANAMMTTLRWHAMLGGMRLRDVTVWLDSEPKRRLFHDVAEEVFGLGEVGLLRAIDLGLPVDPSASSPEGATFLDPRMVTTGRGG
ncbi:MAG: serine/threonine-protein kinase [Deltaproteobacteria bacterium]|nr:serine/threonine-protein kinase [Deltaproteobacteria bacterium]